MIAKLKIELQLLIIGLFLILTSPSYSQTHIFEIAGFLPTKNKIFGDGYQTGYLKQYDLEFNYYFELFNVKQSKIFGGASVNLAPEKLLVRYNSPSSFNSSLSIDDYNSLGIGLYYNTTIKSFPNSHIDLIAGFNTNYIIKTVCYLAIISAKNNIDTVGFEIKTDYYNNSHLRNSIEAELIYYFKHKNSKPPFLGIGLKSKYIFNTMREIDYLTTLNYKPALGGMKKFDFFSFGISLLSEF